MAISIDWGTKTINVPQNYLTFVSGTLYDLNVTQFFRDVQDLLDDELGMANLPAIRHATQVTLGGVTYARAVELINGYTVTFEDGAYRVRLTGANNNISDVTNLNQVSILSQNSSGLQVVTQGSGVTAQDKIDIGNEVWSRTGVIQSSTFAAGAIDAATLGTDAAEEIADAIHDEILEGTLTLRQGMRIMMAVLFGKLSGAGTPEITIRDTQDTKNRVVATVQGEGNRTAVTYNGA